MPDCTRFHDGVSPADPNVFAPTHRHHPHTFNNADQIVSVTTPPPGTGASAQTTTSYFDAMQRATNVVQSDGTSKLTEYFLTGLPKKKYGSRDYPVEYTYDPQGRLKTQTTWTNFAASGGAAWKGSGRGQSRRSACFYVDVSEVNFTRRPRRQACHEHRRWHRWVSQSPPPHCILDACLKKRICGLVRGIEQFTDGVTGEKSQPMS
jgi:hypothetical protein